MKLSVHIKNPVPICLVLTCIILCPVLSQGSVRQTDNVDSENFETMLTNGGNDSIRNDANSNLSDSTTEQNITTMTYDGHTTVSSSSANSTSSTGTQTISEAMPSVVSTSDGMPLSTSTLETSRNSSHFISTVHSSPLSTPHTTPTMSTVTASSHRTTNNVTSVPPSLDSSMLPSLTSTGSILTTAHSSFTPLPRVVINEFHVNYTDWKIGDYIELKGAPNSKLDSYQLVLYGGDGGTSYLTVSLDGFVTRSDGLFLIGDHALKSQLALPIQNILLKDESLHGLALFDGRVFGQIVPDGSPATSNGLLDVLVYAKSQLAIGKEIENLTFGFPRIILDPSLMTSEVSISRCTCCSAFNSLQFRVTIPTPGLENKCNLTNEQSIELSLKDMPCDAVYGRELAMLHTITEMIAQNLQGSCSCGVTSAYIQDAKFDCRNNIIYEARLRTPSDTHLKLLWSYYKSFVKDTASVTLSGVDYTVDSNCFDNCGDPDTPPSNMNVTMIAAVAGCLAVFVIIVGIVVLHIRRRKHGLQNLRSTLFGINNEDEDHLKMEALDNDSDEIYSGGGDPAFNNPWYFDLKQTTPDD